MDRSMSTDQLHGSTLDIYSHLLDEFNPSLNRLVSLGNSYIQAFQGLAVKSEAYFNALSKMGERAFHTRSLGKVLIEIAESQRRLTSELEAIFRGFQAEVLQEMDNNVRMDIDYIAGSKKHYELEVQSQAVALERQHRRGLGQNSGEYLQFLRESNHEAHLEEERRYRFLAEKHCGLIQSLTRLMIKTGGSLHHKVDAWSEEASATRRQEPRMQPMEPMRGREELGSVPSRAPSPENRSRLGSVSDLQGGGRGGGGVRAMRALVAHPASSSNPSMLAFNRGEMINVLMQPPRNGWLYGRADSPSRQGWFPASYVGPLDDPPNSTMSRNSSLGSSSSSSSMSSLLSQSGSSTQSHAPPPPPPPPSSVMINKQATPSQPASSIQPKSAPEKKGLPSSRPHPELFPRGTNPFATVKLKPTATNDRSAPRLAR